MMTSSVCSLHFSGSIEGIIESMNRESKMVRFGIVGMRTLGSSAKVSMSLFAERTSDVR